MTRPLLLVTLTLTAVSQATFIAPAGADDLFSRVPIDSVFSTPSSSATQNPGGGYQPADRGRKILNVEQLADMLRDSGLAPESDGEKLVTVKYQHARWTFSIILGTTEDRDELFFVMLLSELEAKQMSSEKLLALLAANREHQPAVFSFSDKRKRIELSRVIDNVEITPRVLREEMQKLAAIAENTASMWELGDLDSSAIAHAPAAAPPAAAQPQKGVAAAPNSPAPNATQTVASSGLAGKWSASRSAKEAFAMLLKGDGSFVLVYVKDGKQSRSTGKFTLQGSQLTLDSGNGTKIVGSVSNLSQKSFEFTPQSQGGSKLTFQKAS
jgi:hypothetical protein